MILTAQSEADNDSSFLNCEEEEMNLRGNSTGNLRVDQKRSLRRIRKVS
jgi:hypothetical protein